MGMMSKSICRAMLRIMQSGFGGAQIYHSLGDAKDSSGYVYAPLLSAVDRMCITPQGQEPPPFNREFVETDSRLRRKSVRSTRVVLDTTSTYSFTIKGKNIDFCEWSTCGLRLLNPTNLATFIGRNSLRLVAVRLPGHSTGPAQAGGALRKGVTPQYCLELDIAAVETTGERHSNFRPPFTQSDSSDEEDLAEMQDELPIEDTPARDGKADKDVGGRLAGSLSEENALIVNEIMRSDRAVSAAFSTPLSSFEIKARPVSSPQRPVAPPRAQVMKVGVIAYPVEILPPLPPPPTPTPTLTPTQEMVAASLRETSDDQTDNYLIPLPLAADSRDPSVAFDGIYTNDQDRSEFEEIRPTFRMVSVRLERIRMEWISEDLQYCMSAVEINDYRM